MGFKLIIRTFALGAATGAAAMYLADPEGGRRRRAELKERADATASQFGVDIDAKAQELRDKAQGVAAEATRAVRPSGSDDDRTVTDRVRSEVMGDPRFTGVNIDVVDGAATVRGVLDPAEARTDLVSAIHQVSGVERVVDLTHAEGTPAPNL